MNKVITSILSLVVSLPVTLAQIPATTKTLHWKSEKSQNIFSEQSKYFENCSFKTIENEQFPVFYERVKLSNPQSRIRLKNPHYSPVSQTSASRIEIIENQEPVYQYVTYDHGQPVLNIEIFPFRTSSSGLVERLTDFEYSWVTDQTARTSSSHKKAGSFATQSVLNQGDWFKFRISGDGIYKITGEQIANLNLDVSSINASTFKVFGHPGGMLSEVIEDDRVDDLKQLPVELVDHNGNNKMDPTDFIRFYAHGPYTWKLMSGQYYQEKNLYDNYSYIFLTHGGSDAQKIGALASGQGNTSEKTLDYFYDLKHHENDDVNFIESGRYWYGDEFRVKTSQSFPFSVSHPRTDHPGYITHQFAARSIGATSNCKIIINGSTVYNNSFGQVSGDYDDTFGRPGQGSHAFDMTSSGSLSVNYTYNYNGGEGNAWINFFTLSIPVDLTLVGDQTIVRSKEAAEFANVTYEFDGNNYIIWNVTDLFGVSVQNTYSISGSKRGAVINSNNSAVQFALFTDGKEKKSEFVGRVQNQNLHAVKPADFIIISHPDFMDQANELAAFHQKEYGQQVVVANNKLIYNEFSGGKQDPVALRDFIRMYYKRGASSGTPLENVLLIGDGSYDPMNRVENNTNFIPTFQSRNTMEPISSYSSDDFYALLDEPEGYFDILLRKEDLDIGIGRIPCRTVDQAKTMINKVVHYHDPVTFGDWQNRVTFLGDDEDNETHMMDSETVSGYVRDQQPVFNINKIYLDAYEQQSFGSGEKYPDVNIAITKAFEQGTLIFNYLGHGGTSGMAHERVVTRDEIRNWSNYDKLALMVTATCELSRFDDPATDSPGELMLFNSKGGAIGLVTTMRLVQISQNSDINRQFWNNNITNTTNGGKLLGETFRITKNNSNRAVNQRNFSLLADPAMKLAIPIKQVVTTSINDSIVGLQSIDTFKAFSRVKINGQIQTPNGILDSNFNGFVYPTVFDKFLSYQTLGNDDNSSPFSFELQNGVIYRGKVSATKGKFSFQFVVPKDISYHFGSGKISYFAENGVEDAHGYEDDIVVGGSITEIADDKKGPDIDLFLNDETWVFGGTTNPTPLLLCKVFDENGINTVGNGIGRDITAIIDAGTENEKIIVLNDFYQALLDSYQEGEIRYNMEGLSPGRHTLKVRVWDVYNNASEDYTEFVVANDEQLAINNLLNFPNPFTSSTTFHFDHNKAGQQLSVLIQIVTPTGKIVKSFHKDAASSDTHFDDVFWNGRDEFGDKLARGVYLYKVTVRSEDGEMAEATQKLVLLK